MSSTRGRLAVRRSPRIENPKVVFTAAPMSTADREAAARNSRALRSSCGKGLIIFDDMDIDRAVNAQPRRFSRRPTCVADPHPRPALDFSCVPLQNLERKPHHPLATLPIADAIDR